MSDGLIASFIERINANTLAYDNARAKRTESASAMFQEHPGDREDSGSAEEEEEEEEVAPKKSFKSLILKNLFSSKSGNDADDESEVTVEEDTCSETSDEDDKDREEEEEVEEDQDQEQERVPKEGDSKVTIGVEGPVTSRQPSASFLNQSSHHQILRGTKSAETNLYVSPIFGEDRVYLEHDEKGYVDIAIDGLTVSKTAGKGDFCGGAMLYPHLSEESARSHFLTLSQILINDGYRPNPKGNSSSESSNSNREHASGEDSAEKEEVEVAPKKSTKSSTKNSSSSKAGNDADDESEVTVEEDTCSETSDEDDKDREEEEEDEDGYERVNKELASLLAQASSCSAQPLGVGNVASSLALQPFATALNPPSSLQLLGGVKPAAVSSLYLGPVYLENDKDDFVEIAISDGRMLSITSGKVGTCGNVSSCPHISEEKTSIHFNETVQIYMNDGYRPKLKPENLTGSTAIQESSNRVQGVEGRWNVCRK